MLSVDWGRGGHEFLRKCVYIECIHSHSKLEWEYGDKLLRNDKELENQWQEKT